MRSWLFCLHFHHFHYSSSKTQPQVIVLVIALLVSSRPNCDPSVAASHSLCRQPAWIWGLVVQITGCKTFGGSRNRSELPFFSSEKINITSLTRLLQGVNEKQNDKMGFKHPTQCLAYNKHQIMDASLLNGGHIKWYLGNLSRLLSSTRAKIFVSFGTLSPHWVDKCPKHSSHSESSLSEQICWPMSPVRADTSSFVSSNHVFLREEKQWMLVEWPGVSSLCFHPYHYNVLIAFKPPPIPVLSGKPFKLTVLPPPPTRKVPLSILEFLRSFIPYD